MGTGNWSIRGGVTVILEEDVSEPFWYEDFRDNLSTCLSAAWSPAIDKWYDRNSKVQYESSTNQIVTHTDDYGNVFVCFLARAEIGNPIERAVANKVELWAQTVFDKLQKFYPDMRVASSAWTSTKRLTHKERLFLRV